MKSLCTMMDTRVAIMEFVQKMFCNHDEIISHVTVANQGIVNLWINIARSSMKKL